MAAPQWAQAQRKKKILLHKYWQNHHAKTANGPNSVHLSRAHQRPEHSHDIHINLNTIFYTHVEHSPTETIYIKYYMENKHTQNTMNFNMSDTDLYMHMHTYTRTDCSRNWVLVLVGVEILCEEEGF